MRIEIKKKTPRCLGRDEDKREVFLSQDLQAHTSLTLWILAHLLGATSCHVLMFVILLTNSNDKKKPRGKAGPVQQGGTTLNSVSYLFLDPISCNFNYLNLHERSLAH